MKKPVLPRTILALFFLWPFGFDAGSVACAGDVNGPHFCGALPVDHNLKSILGSDSEIQLPNNRELDATYVVFKSSSCRQVSESDALKAAGAVVEADPGKGGLPAHFVPDKESMEGIWALGAMTLFCPGDSETPGRIVLIREDTEKNSRYYVAYGLVGRDGFWDVEWPDQGTANDRPLWASPQSMEFLGFLQTAGKAWAFAVRMPGWMAVLDLEGSSVYEGRVFTEPYLVKSSGESALVAPVVVTPSESDLESMPGESPAEKRFSLATFELWELRVLTASGRDVLSSTWVPRTTRLSVSDAETQNAKEQALLESERVHREYEQQQLIVRPESIGIPRK